MRECLSLMSLLWKTLALACSVRAVLAYILISNMTAQATTLLQLCYSLHAAARRTVVSTARCVLLGLLLQPVLLASAA
jgi:hypothetical protein